MTAKVALPKLADRCLCGCLVQYDLRGTIDLADLIPSRSPLATFPSDDLQGSEAKRVAAVGTALSTLLSSSDVMS